MSAASGTAARVDDPGRFADNVTHFARTLRKAGMRVGPASARDAVAALCLAGIGDRDDFYWMLHAIFVQRREDHAVFDQAFRLFWRNRDLVEKMIAMFSPVAPDTRPKERPKAGETRVNDALFADQDSRREMREKPQIEVDARLTASGDEVLRSRDFAQMSAAELAAARQAIARLHLPFDQVASRRFSPSPHPGRVDPRATMRAALRTGGDLIVPRYHKRRTVQPPLVVLADISGSMSQYTRIFLHFMHLLAERRRRVHTFLFGTRLTNVTRQMRFRDPDEAVDECVGTVSDWSGGTRIGEAISEFNRHWSRRVLGQGATVILVTDGLEREAVEELDAAMDRLQRSCRRLIWLNPLLRFEGFEARARGVRTIMRHVDEIRAIHSLDAMSDLVAALGDDRHGQWDPRLIPA
ncbi:vWA domain-containing protein [Pseudohoeflea coraliihabitans]|uniref:VWA domain-containing protein n=1 Tax=Pseudohoeflea coraliihabitans TaxID=2860393 RepID=A0ABS6WSB9_9HYPH|nr:VWA domain-containing protein [Pseudohoeflea sp. DP4N28-3]MBW3098851.1 VWA domain-containing protein [Pseudohoeflea sp. DP4N28-3]